MSENFRENPDELYDKNTLVFADITDSAKAKARDVALEKSTETTEKPKGFWASLKNFGKSIWKRSEIFQTKERYEALKKIRDTGNLYAHEEGASKESHNKEVEAITQRFTAKREFESDLIHAAAGETRSEVGDSEKERHFKEEINKIIRAYARTGDEADFNNSRAQLLSGFGKGKVYADNLFEFAKNAREYVRQQVDQQVTEAEALSNLDTNFKVIIGKAKAGVRTEAQYNAVDVIVDKVQNMTGGVLNEKAVAVAAASVNALFSKVVQGSVRRAAGVFGLGTLAAGGAAAAKESRKIELERMQHAREMAQGKKVKNETEAKRRQELEKSRIETKTVSELQSGLNTALFDKLSDRDAKDLTQDEYKQALSALSDIDSRIQISDNGIVKAPKTSKWQFWRKGKSNRLDLISFSDVASVEQERRNLDVARAKAKIKLKEWAAHNGSDFNNDLNLAKSEKTNEIFNGDTGIKKQNEIFHKLKRERVVKAFAKGVLIGGAVGLAVQEIRAAFDSETEGALEHGWKELWGNHHDHSPGQHVTLAEGVRRRIQNLFEHSNQAGPNFTNLHEQTVGAHHFKLPAGMDMRPDGHGDYQIFDHGHAVTDSFKLNTDGSLTPDAQKYLQDHGFGPHADLSHAVGSGSTGKHLNLDETRARFAGLDKHARVDWHDNPGPHYSNIHHKIIEYEGKQQELFLEQAKDGAVSVNGRMIIKNLAENLRDRLDDPDFGLNPDGSFDQKLIDLRDKLQSWVEDGTLQDHLQIAVIPTEAANKAGLSMLYEGFHNGKLTLPPELSGMFTDPKMLRDGHLPFRFMEFRIDGHVIATAQGPDLTVPGSEVFITTVIGHPGSYEGTPGDFITEPPFVLPLTWRKGLEEMERKVPPVYYGYDEISPEERALLRQDMSPRLLSDSNARLDPAVEIPWYFQDQERRYPGYREQLENLNNQIGAPMGPNTEAVIALAVAGHQEHANIYRTLEVYAEQKKKDGSSVWQGDQRSYEVLLYINWPQGSDPSKTFEEVNRFKASHPEVPVRVVGEEINNGKVEVGFYKKKAFDLGLLRHLHRGNGKDIFIIANDADTRYASPLYLEYCRDTMNDPNNEQYDSFLGRQDLDPEVYEKNPTFHAAMRFWHFMDSVFRAKKGNLYTQGRNTIMRGVSYAAVGGNRTKDFWADIEFGKLFEAARNGKHTMAFTNRAWVMVDPRREIDKFKSGEKIAHTWFDFNTRSNVRGGGRAENAAPENLDVVSLADKSEDSLEVVAFRNRLQEEIQAIIDVFTPNLAYNLSPKDSNKSFSDLEVIRRSAEFLGVKIRFEPKPEGVSVIITDTKLLRENLREYKVENRKRLKLDTDAYFPAPVTSAAETLPSPNEAVPVSPSAPDPKTSLTSEQLAQEVVRLENDFETDPFKYLFGDGLSSLRTKKLSINGFIEGLGKKYGISDSEYAQVRQDAENSRNLKGVPPGQKQLIFLIKEIMQKNPGLKDSWKGLGEYQRAARFLVESEATKKIKNKNLTEQDIDLLAQEFSIDRNAVIDSIIYPRPRIKKEADRQFNEAVRKGRLVNNENNRALVRWEVLEEYQKRTLKSPGRTRRSSSRRKK